MQPVVTLTVTAGRTCNQKSKAVRADVRVGQPVSFLADAAVPTGTGALMRTEWDFQGTGSFVTLTNATDAQRSHRECMTHSYVKPGTYFAVVRVTSQRAGDRTMKFGQIQNLARVRIVVT